MTSEIPAEVVLQPVALRDREVLANLLELYQHDLSEVFPVEIGPNGRFGYEFLPLYWSEPERRFPFFIMSGQRVVGFVLVMAGSPVSEDPDVHDVAEFFVLRRYRRSGVGRRAAFLVWDRFPSGWTVRVSLANVDALPFWARVTSEYANGEVTTFERSGTTSPWRVFSFGSRRRPAG